MTSNPSGGNADPGSGNPGSPPQDMGLLLPDKPGGNGDQVNSPAPGAAPPGAPPPPPDMEQTAAALATGDPESFYVSAQWFEGMSDTFVNVAERIRAQTTYLEQVWQGPAAQGFTNAMREVNRTVDKLVETLAVPSYGSMLNQLGDALADAQRQVGQMKDQRQQGRDEFTASPAAADPAAQAAIQQQETTHNEQTAQVLQQLSNTYYNIGKQLGQFPEKSVRGNAVAVDPESAFAAGGNGSGSGGSGGFGGSSGSGGSGGAPVALGLRTNAGSSYSADQGVLGRQASTYGTSNEPADVYSAEVNEQGVVRPQDASGERSSVAGAPAESASNSAVPYGLGAGGSLRTSGNGGWTKSDKSSGGESEKSAPEVSGQDGSVLERSGSQEAGQPSTESLFNTPDKPELSGDQVEQQFAAAAEGPPPAEGVESDLVPNYPPPADTDGAPSPESENSSVTSGASAGSGGSGGSVPSVSMPSTAPPDVGQISAAPPGSVAGNGATVPTAASATGVPGSAPGAPVTASPAAGGAAGGSGSPMMPMGGGMSGMGGMGGQLGRGERFATTLQQEDEETWNSGADITGGVLGR